MSRRDTIIVAVLINVGLLIVLFASAVKSGNSSEEFVMAPPKKIDKQEILVKDEVDQVLSQYAKSSPVIASPIPEVIPAQVPVVSLAQSTPNPFEEELKIAKQAETPILPSSIVAAPVATIQDSVKEEMPSFVDYKVKKGDVLEKIARHHHCSVQDLKKANNLTSTALKIGQTLKIPKVNKVLVTQVAKDKAEDKSSAKYYTIKPGDNPWTIAIKNHIKVEELLKLNHLDEEKARKLKAGDQIRVQ